MINDNEGPKRRTDTIVETRSPTSNSNSKANSHSHSNDANANATVSPNSELKQNASVLAAAAHAAVPNWANLVLMISLIFGGCCANVS